MKAVLLVDIQNDFLPGGSLPVPEGNKIINVVNCIIPMFDLVIATQDWHPSDHKSFASMHKDKKPFEIIMLKGKEQTLWPDHCIQGTKGADFSPDLAINRIEAIFRKGTNSDIDSYSGFYDNDHIKTTGLCGYLKDKNVTQLYLAGLAAEICVFFTAIDSLKEGFDTILIEDAMQALIPANFEKAKIELKEQGGKLLTSGQLFYQ